MRDSKELRLAKIAFGLGWRWRENTIEGMDQKMIDGIVENAVAAWRELEEDRTLTKRDPEAALEKLIAEGKLYTPPLDFTEPEK